MKVLQLIQKAQLRGAEIFAMQLSQELVKLGVVVDCIYLFDGADKLSEMFPAIKFRALGGNVSRRFFDIRSYRQLARWIKEGKYDLVQANAGDTLKYASFSRILSGWNAPLVFRNANTMSGFIRNDLHRQLNRLWINQCAYVISVSESCRQDIISLFPSISRRTSTITIGTYVPAFVPAIASPHPVFINVGSFVHEKNHTFLLDVFAAYVSKGNPGALWLVGDGPLRNVLTEKVASLRLTDRVRFLGYQSDIPSLLRSCTAMIMPSLIEGLPAVILEAMAHGVPVVASAVGGIPEVIDEGKNGYCVRNFEAAEYVSAMESIASNASVHDMLATAGYATVSSRFQLEKIAASFLEKYREIVA